MSALDEQEAEHPNRIEPKSIADPQAEGATPREPRGLAATFTRNSILSVGRVFVSAIIAFILPSYLTHKLSVTTYAAWVLILQVSAYVGYLEFGIQTGISKYVAEYEAKNDTAGSSMRASSGLALMLIAAVSGIVLTLILAWQVPQLFNEMPASLYRDVRFSIAFVGVSLSFGLFCSTFSSIFFGLQRYAVPMMISTLNRILYTASVLAAVALHESLATMGALVAVVNIVTGALQFEAWRRLAKKVRLSLSGLDLMVVKQMLAYCSTLAIWSAGMLCISGLDVTIVGKYDFGETAFYAIAVLPTTFMSAIMGAAIAPLIPTASGLSVHRSPHQMGVVLSRATRYASLLLLASGLPLLVGGYWVLRFWVGAAYAMHTIGYLRILVLANILRNMCMPYASMLVATNSQKIAIAGVIAEATVNVTCSIYLAQHMGAIGVAYGTLLGSVVSVAAHFALNMRYTKAKFAVSRVRLFLTGLARPCAIAIPSLILVRLWWSKSAPTFGWQVGLAWGLCTLLLTWFAALNAAERAALVRLVDRRPQPANKL
jgi:O-antigen/teichoic acid export membrane protein